MSTAPTEVLLRQLTEGSSLPVIGRPIDNTALQAYMACPREYYLGMVKHMRGSGRSPALVFGSAWHKALEWHYKSGGNYAIVDTMVEASWEGHDSPDDYRTLERVLADYRKFVRDSRFQDFADTVGYPHSPMVELSTNSMAHGLLHPWAGKLDRIVKVGGLVYVEDHKTTSRFDKNYWKQWGLSHQMKGYTFLAQQLMPDLQVAGVRVNLSHVLTNKTEFHRNLYTYTPGEIKEWVRVTNTWTRRLARDYEVLQQMLEKGVEHWEALDESFPAHFGDNGCSRKYGMCAYHSVCGVNSKLRDRMLEREFEYNPWNPLETEEVE